MRPLLPLCALLAGCTGAPGPGGGSLDAADIVGSATGYTSLRVAIDHVPGKGPDADALDDLESELGALRSAGALAKPDGIDAQVLSGAVEGVDDPDTVRTLADLRALSDTWAATHEAADGEALLHMLYVDGRYEGDDGDGAVLGFAYGGDRMVMFADNIARACEGGPLLGFLPAVRARLCSDLEGSVLIHEVGHLLGLVNNGTPMVADHQDEPNGAHDVNEDCVMYWAAERSSAADLIADRFQNGDEGALSFDAACLNDLRAVTGASR